MTTTEKCPTCKGKCCGYDADNLHEYGHTGLPFHICPDCDDGTVPEPSPRPVRTAEDERADVLAYLRRAMGFPNPTLPLDRYLALLVESIEDGEHEGVGKSV